MMMAVNGIVWKRFILIVGCIVLCRIYGVDCKEDWGYVTVRPQAHMFWWLYQTTSANQSVPLVMWLQGGPGGSSTGFGNFQEIGPLDVQLQPRNTTWLSEANLLFVDNPVGTGYSYVTDDSAYTTNVQEIAQDLLTLFKAFLKHSPQFQSTPFYIFCESYGGKMVAAFSLALSQAIQRGEISVNFRGAALGDSWISPMDSVNTWGPYLYATSLVDSVGLQKVQDSARKTQALVNEGKWVEATNSWSVTEDIVEEVTNGVNFYNILDWGSSESFRNLKYLTRIDRLYQRHVAYMQEDNLSALMNGPIRQKLGVIPKNVTWGAQAGKVFEKQSGDFMKPVIDIVNTLVEKCTTLGYCLDVVVYSGQLDLIVDTLGTEAWVSNLKIFPAYNQAKRKVLYDPISKQPGAYLKENKNFAFYWILDAGHMVPADNGNMALEMLRLIINKR